MPRIQFSDDDLRRGTVITPGWYTCDVRGVGEKLAKNGESTNYPVDGVIVCDELGGEEFKDFRLDFWQFNSKALGFATGFLRAFGVEPESHKVYDLSQCMGHVDVFIENDVYQGRTVNRINHKYRKASR